LTHEDFEKMAKNVQPPQCLLVEADSPEERSLVLYEGWHDANGPEAAEALFISEKGPATPDGCSLEGVHDANCVRRERPKK
jgi:hypothetical protein